MGKKLKVIQSDEVIQGLEAIISNYRSMEEKSVVDNLRLTKEGCFSSADVELGLSVAYRCSANILQHFVDSLKS